MTSEKEKAFREAALRLYGAEDSIARAPKPYGSLREIIVTPVPSQYGECYTTVLSINGSPPRGTFVVFGDRYPGGARPDYIIYMDALRSRRLPRGGNAFKAVADYVNELRMEGRL